MDGRQTLPDKSVAGGLFHRLWRVCAQCVVGTVLCAPLLAADAEPAIRVIDGFEVSLYADDNLAHDIYSMTFDSQGRVVVSGPGYVRILIDDDGDGHADRYKQFASPRTGSQGMAFHGRDLICTAEKGLVCYRDKNADDVADGKPDLFIQLKAGGEHDAHAVRRGPDGWWYVLTGNMAQVDEKYITLPTSPVAKPQAGVLLRLKPDLSGGEAVVDGLRNAYDFDFTPQGDAYTFESDGEREMSLPWYLPTRVFQLLPGSSGGWISKDWKRPDYFYDMPPVPAAFGRGSPTGVVCYRHTQFPAPYRGALFVFDWTYGKAFVMKLSPEGSVWSSTPVEFLSAVGENGFAPTDAEVGPDGCLYVCVGGRGTRGGVYRIRSKSSDLAPIGANRPLTSRREKLEACLNAPQPLSAWSRRKWEPLSLELGAVPFVDAALESQRSLGERLRALEILTDRFPTDIDGTELLGLTTDESPVLRAKLAWLIGRIKPRQPNVALLNALLADDHPRVRRMALESALGAGEESLAEISASLPNCLNSPDRFVRMAAARILSRCSSKTYNDVARNAVNGGWQSAIAVATGFSQRKPGFQSYPVEVGRRILKGDQAMDLKLQATRLIELGLGDLTPPTGDSPNAFDGYSPRLPLTEHDQELNPLRATLDELYPTGDQLVDRELTRIVAMVQPASDRLLTKIAASVTENTDPIDDIHQLLAAARMPVPRTADQRLHIAQSLLSLEIKFKKNGLSQDLHWDDRIGELYSGLVSRDKALPLELLKHPDFGLAGHVPFVSKLPPQKMDEAIGRFMEKIHADPSYKWSSDLVFLLGGSRDPAIRELVRSKFEDYALRNAVLMSLAESPRPEDRSLFVKGLESSPTEALAECVKALALMRPSDDPEEQVALVRTFRRLSIEDQEREIRDQVFELLRRNLQEDFGYRLAKKGDPQQAAIEQWVEHVRQLFPKEYAAVAGDDAGDLEQLRTVMNRVDWSQGDPRRGAELFQTRACQQCHGSRQAIGPSLIGVARRFSKEDLFTAILLPSRDVSPRYQTTAVQTEDGKVFTGLIVYEAVDAIVLRNGSNQTFRVDTKEIASKRVLSTSLMPTGLLKGLAPPDYADLYAFLKTLGSTQTASADAKAERAD